MGTPEERLAAVEASLVQVTAQLQISQTQNIQLAEQLTAAQNLARQAQEASTQAARQAQAAAAGPPAAQPAQGLGVDTRLLGRPSSFDGDDAKWTDWSIVVKGYCAVAHRQLGPLMQQAEEADSDAVVMVARLDGANSEACRQLYYILLLLCTSTALNIVVNAGQFEGLLAWRRLHQRYEPKVRTRFAGQMLELLNWSFEGDVQQRLELFERAVTKFETDSAEVVSDAIRIGIVLRQLPEGALKQHLLLNAERLRTWPDFKAEVVMIRRAQVALGPTPMDIGAFNKGSGKGAGGGKPASNVTCWSCGKKGHRAAECRSKPKGSGKGAKGAKGGKSSGKGGGKKGGKGTKGARPPSNAQLHALGQQVQQLQAAAAAWAGSAAPAAAPSAATPQPQTCSTGGSAYVQMPAPGSHGALDALTPPPTGLFLTSLELGQAPQYPRSRVGKHRPRDDGRRLRGSCHGPAQVGLRELPTPGDT